MTFLPQELSCSEEEFAILDELEKKNIPGLKLWTHSGTLVFSYGDMGSPGKPVKSIDDVLHHIQKKSGKTF